MSDNTVIEHCSPTLAGIKTGSLFSFEYEDADEARGHIKRLNGIFVRKGLRAVPLAWGDRRVQVYIYRPSQLRKVLEDREASAILRRLGYDAESPDSCVRLLSERIASMAAKDGFPHEIGLFLGYPPVDVKGFMEHKGRGARLTGPWKVYGDTELALRRFRAFKKCTEDYKARMDRGATLEGLIVALAD